MKHYLTCYDCSQRLQDDNDEENERKGNQYYLLVPKPKSITTTEGLAKPLPYFTLLSKNGPLNTYDAPDVAFRKQCKVTMISPSPHSNVILFVLAAFRCMMVMFTSKISRCCVFVCMCSAYTCASCHVHLHNLSGESAVQ